MKVHGLAVARRKRRTPRTANGKVEVVKVDARIMKTALRIAGGDASRITIISRTRVEVR